MSDDDLVEHFRVGFELLEARIASEPDGPLKNRAETLTEVAHRALGRLRRFAADDGVVQPFSSGDKDPPGGP